MKITSSYGVEIRKADGALSTTLKIYREAVRVLALFYDTVWDDLSAVKEEKKRFNRAEHMVHSTKRNHAVYDFDSLFPKMPSYLRRSAITHALGAVSSYRTRLAQWEEGGRKGKGTRPSASCTTERTGCGSGQPASTTTWSTLGSTGRA